MFLKRVCRVFIEKVSSWLWVILVLVLVTLELIFAWNRKELGYSKQRTTWAK